MRSGNPYGTAFSRLFCAFLMVFSRVFYDFLHILYALSANFSRVFNDIFTAFSTINPRRFYIAFANFQTVFTCFYTFL
jgi:hypothetical protein